MKKIFKVLLVVALIGLLAVVAGCGQKAEEKEGGTPEPAETKFKVAMLLPGTINDQGWNASAHAGLLLAEKELGAEIAFNEKVAPSDYEEVFRGYASQGYNVVFGHGFEFGDAAMKVAKEFPDVNFVVTSTGISQEPNVTSLKNNNMQQGFLAGVVAALMSKSKVVGTVGGMEIPSIIDYNVGFEIGAKYIDPNIKVLSAFTGNFDDAAKAKETANAMIKEGADIVTHDADQAGLGVFEAAKENNVLAIGAVGDQASLAPDTIITSALSDMSKAIALAAKLAKNGELKPQAYKFGINEDVVGLAPFRNFEDKVSAEQKAKIDEVVEGLKSGAIDVEAMAPKK